MNVFVVDDDHLSGKLLKRALERFGFEVIECRDGVEALQLLESTGPALLVLDYQMPELNGAQICEIIRKDPSAEIAEIPIILLTAHSDEENEIECLNAGADDFVTKPVNLAVLKARIDTHLRLYTLRRQLQQQNSELERYRVETERDLEAARLTQLAIVPRRLPQFSGWDLAACLKPLIQVGGDIYDVAELPDGGILLWIADGTGHGAAAALLTTLSKLIFRHAALPGANPAEIMQSVQREFYGIFRGRAFMTAACIVMHPCSGKITMSGAGHPPLLIRRADGTHEIVSSNSPPIGVIEKMETSETSVELHPGDAFLFHTDGLYDVIAKDGSRLTPKSLATLLPMPDGTAEAFLDSTIANVLRHGDGKPFSDDVAAIAALMLPCQ